MFKQTIPLLAALAVAISPLVLSSTAYAQGEAKPNPVLQQALISDFGEGPESTQIRDPHHLIRLVFSRLSLI